MALVKCKECSAQISSSAKACPQCGAKVTRTSVFTWLAAFLIVPPIFLTVFNQAGAPPPAPPPPKTPEQIALQAKQDAEFQRVLVAAKMLKASMKDPDSLEIESALLMAEGSICIEYRGRNSFNAKVLEHFVLSKAGGSREASAWNKYCAGKSGSDYRSVRQAL